ncbi:class I SAM-dependent methyltransferase [Microtetraspora sp. NBRC 16547]|uniref:class I SAM-dependent methyltransferase n=1 Tax=Microtetraspora sp. NBRC 16547 TaxID=3030993 RepID=UPI0024A5330D|nr:class I SAM-dependent methyltransferase [Microtetraspora sp. NBRC 16547]GLW98754.1 putative polyketide synthase protein [Microtetraspora sp. NBRC 16547]
MTSEKVAFTGVRQTLLVTLYGRALDSRSDHPVLGDRTAQDTVRRVAYDFTTFRMSGGEAAVVAMRGRQFDEWTAEFLAAHPDATVVHLGCGLDGRVFRIAPPPRVRWFDVDYPEVVDLRRRLYPESPGYRLIGSSVTDPGWLPEIPGDRPTLVVAEGLTMYLTDSSVETLVHRIANHFSVGGQIVFDAVSPLGIRAQRLNRILRTTGATLTWGLDDPHRLESWDPRFTLLTELAVVDLPWIDRLPPRYRLACRLMQLIPALRKVGLLLRYQFSP